MRYRDQLRRLRALEGADARRDPAQAPPYVVVGEGGLLYRPDGALYTGQAPVKGYQGISPDDWDEEGE